ncbi:oxysterol-binding protein-related protein 8-like isoform X2 [Liolophura sinensis]|uniref:oxysterol-binding protein-related protein 8-like isoform X2 n=2 Tax=Liolophura sinensis TaxID=3198878 RepID=UPI0031590F0B
MKDSPTVVKSTPSPLKDGSSKSPGGSDKEVKERASSFSKTLQSGFRQSPHTMSTHAMSTHSSNNDLYLHAGPMEEEGSDVSVLSNSQTFEGHRSKSDGKLSSPMPEKSPIVKLSKRESLKVQKKNYRSQKKQAAKELLSTLKDPSVIVMADWLKVRGTLKSWTKLWCVLKPGLLILYKSQKQKSSHWVGTILLNTCELIERPSKKDGFCFKLFHPLDQSIWATKGPKGETIGAITQPLPYSYLIFRAPSESAGKCWMDALELALRCTSLLMRSMTKEKDNSHTTSDESLLSPTFHTSQREQMNESDCERHFEDDDLEDDGKTDKDDIKTESETSQSEEEDDDTVFVQDAPPLETPYTENKVEELGQQGDECQTEEVNEENKSLIWTLVKQVRPGMDLSKVVLPTFILEPRSFLDKLSDYYYHSDLLSEAVLQEDPYTRMKCVCRWYLSGFYKKPKGLKKPYNPIIGETFRCYWKHPKTKSRTFYIAEQISHHPPVSAFYVTNRQDGFNISGSILAKSKFYGNSLSAILDGTAKLTFLKRGEDYFITMPYAHCKGILIGTLTMEFGGKVYIDCPKTGYRCELEFKLKPFLGSGGASNRVAGKIKLASDTLATIEGHWDMDIYIKDKNTGTVEQFWNPTPDIKAQRLKRYTVPLEVQGDMESERLWKQVSDAVITSNMHSATQEKFILEERQRQEAKERKAQMLEWVPKLFERDLLTGDWIYRYVDMRPWDPINDVIQYEKDFIIQTQTHHRTPVVRTRSITSLEQKKESRVYPKSADRIRPSHIQKIQRAPSKHLPNIGDESESSAAEAEPRHDSDSSGSAVLMALTSKPNEENCLVQENVLQKALEPLIQAQQDTLTSLKSLQQQVHQMQYRQQKQENSVTFLSQHQSWIILAVILTFQTLLQWLFK